MGVRSGSRGMWGCVIGEPCVVNGSNGDVTLFFCVLFWVGWSKGKGVLVYLREVDVDHCLEFGLPLGFVPFGDVVVQFIKDAV